MRGWMSVLRKASVVAGAFGSKSGAGRGVVALEVVEGELRARFAGGDPAMVVSHCCLPELSLEDDSL